MSEFQKFAADPRFLDAYFGYHKIMEFVKSDAKYHPKAMSSLSLYTEADGSVVFTDMDGGEDRDDHPIPSSFDALWWKYCRYGENHSKKSEFIGCRLYLVDESFQQAASRHETRTKDPENQHRYKTAIKHETKVALQKEHSLSEGLRSECSQE